jgi:hypothetical protein
VGRQVEVPGTAVLALAGGGAWLVGSAALSAGFATVVLAVGIAVTVWLVIRTSRAAGVRGPRLDRDGRRRVVSIVVVGIVLIAVGTTLLRATDRGELAVPLGVAVCGALLLPLASVLDRRGLLVVGAALMVLGAAGALVALNSVGRAEPQGLVGLGGGVLLWIAAAQGAGLTGELRTRIRR